MSRAGFGKPKYSGTSFKKTGKVSRGDNHIRIAPPMGACAEEGIWRVFRVTHWGYSGVNPREPGKTVMRPFQCIREKDRRTGMIKRECPACVRYEALQEEAKEREAKLRAAGKSKDEIETAMASINEQLKAFRPEAKWYVNALFLDGTVGDFKLNHKDHMSRIMAIIEGAGGKKGLKEAEGIEPLDPEEGVWFVITRTGDGIQPPDSVDLAYEEVDVPGFGKAKRVKRAPLSDEQCEKLLKECPDLSTRGGTVLDYDQIAALVKCSGNPEEVDKVFASAKTSEPVEADDTVSTADAPAAKTESAPATPPANTTAAPPTKSGPTPEQQARYEAIMKKRADEAAAKAAAEAAAKAAAEASAKPPLMDLDDDAFVKSFMGQ